MPDDPRGAEGTGEVSYGLCVCSVCKHEVHQSSGDRSWLHCEGKTPLCEGAKSVFPGNTSEIQGKWCGMDDLDGDHGSPRYSDAQTECAHSPAIVHRTGGKSAKLDNHCGKCGAHIVRKVPAGAWKVAA